MIQATRRDFVKTCAGMTAVAAVPGIKLPTNPRDRLAVASYPFREFFGRNGKTPAMTLKEFPKIVVDKFGVHNIEPLGTHFTSLDPAYLAEIRTAVERANSNIVNIPVSVGASFYDPAAAGRDKAVANGKKWVDAAAVVGSPSLRVHIQGAKNVKPDVDLTAESLKRLSDYGASKHVVILLENDDPETEDAFFLVKVIEKAKHPNLFGLPDFCNSMLKRNEKYNYDSVTAMFRHVHHLAHVKDSEVDQNEVIRIDLAKTFKIAKASGFRGYYSMEWEGKGGPEEGTKFLLEQTLKNI